LRHSRPITLDDLRHLAATQTLFAPTTLKRALDRLGFVQADPIRAPARAQDLVLRHRVEGYRAGDLERRYATLGIEEDFFINYGFVTRGLQALMHPRPDATVPADGGQPWRSARGKRTRLLLDFVRERGPVHPREVDEHFAHGTPSRPHSGRSAAARISASVDRRGRIETVDLVEVHVVEAQALEAAVDAGQDVRAREADLVHAGADAAAHLRRDDERR
jgi:uncharacterized protein YcaQ